MGADERYQRFVRGASAGASGAETRSASVSILGGVLMVASFWAGRSARRLGSAREGRWMRDLAARLD
ncbi:hypothetical protein ACFPRL_17625 [Pseudoclavibacter helvolus]